jgi:hypothetical protein
LFMENNKYAVIAVTYKMFSITLKGIRNGKSTRDVTKQNKHAAGAVGKQFHPPQRVEDAILLLAKRAKNEKSKSMLCTKGGNQAL